MDGSQLTGSTSSYARKYALSGLYNLDDTKDSDGLNKGNKQEAKAANPPAQKKNYSQGSATNNSNSGMKCTGCGTNITPGVKTVSENKYGKALCMNCQNKQ